jgi:drug/metabolite transporter (DMT)-like permease
VDPPGSGRRPGYALVLVASLFWATSGLLSRLVFDARSVEPRQLAALRVYGAALLLVPLVIRARPRLDRRGWLKVAAFGVFGVSLPQWVYFEAIARIPVPIALVIVYTAPVIVTVFERFARHTRLPVPVYLAIGVAVAGVVLAVTGGKGGAGALPVVGVVLAIVTAFAYALQILVSATQPAELPPLVRTGLGMLAGAIFWTVFSPLWGLPFGRIDDAVDLGPRVAGSLPTGVLVLCIIVFGTVVPYTLLVAGSPKIGLGASSVTGMIEPVAASILFWLVLDQRLTTIQVIGVIVALGGVTGAELMRNRVGSDGLGAAGLADAVTHP